LNAVLEKWLPVEMQKRIAAENDPVSTDAELDHDIGEWDEWIEEIEGLDVEEGIVMTGGSVEYYKKILRTFMYDGANTAEKIKNCLESKDLSMYVTHVHALKSATGSIGAFEASEMARKLEMAGSQGDLAFLEANTSRFLSQLDKLINNIRVALNVENT
jgi:HPt (histidine-containing phosphotransfer) domain-containing protein